jgi:uncharacterized protein YjiK
MKKIIFGILVLIVGVLTFFSFKEKPSENSDKNLNYEILQKWDLPDALDEVSGIAWLGKDRIACVQDEDGIIFIYNLQTSQIENEIEFGGGGDYEGIAVIEDDAYVLRSDGVIFEVIDFESTNPQVTKKVTKANALPGINFEGLCADPVNNRLLLAVKERKDSQHEKDIFAFDLNKKDSGEQPEFKVSLSDPLFDRVDGKLKDKFSPGELNIHPHSGELFILDGTRPKLLIVDKGGTLKELFIFSSKDFANPEGLTFNSEGDLFISNEAEEGPANILRVSLNRK